MTAESWSGLVLRVGAEHVLVGPEGAALALAWGRAAERAAARDGIGASAAMRELLAVLEPVAMSARGHADVRRLGVVSASAVSEEIGSEEAAVLIGKSTRTVGRLARAGRFGPCRKVGGRLLVSRAEVAAYAAGRSAS